MAFVSILPTLLIHAVAGIGAVVLLRVWNLIKQLFKK